MADKTKFKKVEIKFTEKELDLLITLTGVFFLDKEASKPFGFTLEESLALNNKLGVLKIQNKIIK